MKKEKSKNVVFSKLLTNSHSQPSIHKPVLLNEIIEGLDVQNGDVILDATVNGGGHASEIARRFKGLVTLIGLDLDIDALSRADKNISGKKILLNYNFRNLDQALHEAQILKVDKVLFDLGLSSDQLHNSGRGFSFQKDEPLLMTLSKTAKRDAFTAKDIVNKWDSENIAAIIKGYGEERYAKRIANHIVRRREISAIKTSAELAEIIKVAVPTKDRFQRIHPATKTFQALRIAVNDELEALKEGLGKAFDHLNSNGRIAVISFHSLEDRIVKHFMKNLIKKKLGRTLTKKPLKAGEEETKNNPRSRSAKLRIIEKL